MHFTDLTFLFVFMPVLLAAYYIVKPQYRRYILLAFSLMFYACGSVTYFSLMSALIVVNIICAYIIVFFRDGDKHMFSKIFMILGAAGNVSVLCLFKYLGTVTSVANSILGLNMATSGLLLPLGLSFFTFKAISYLVDLYNKKIESVSALELANYLSFFAQIQSGPIERYNDYIENRIFSTDMFSKGAVRFMLGVSKKVVIADTIGNIVLEIFDRTEVLSTSLAWLGTICYGLQLYIDFSSYSDMAIGIGNMLGIECPENFNYPFITQSVSEFWRRWHISLGNWFRDYVYIPLGGSRKGKVRTYINLFVVWILTGIWHGTGLQFIVWGIAYGLAISVEKALGIPGRIKSKVGKIVYRVWTLLYINLTWVLFRSSNLSDAISYFKSMFLYCSIETGVLRTKFLLSDYFLFIIVAIILCVPVDKFFKDKLSNTNNGKMVYDVISGVIIGLMFILALSFIVSGMNNPFLYMNF